MSFSTRLLTCAGVRHALTTPSSRAYAVWYPDASYGWSLRTSHLIPLPRSMTPLQHSMPINQSVNKRESQILCLGRRNNADILCAQLPDTTVGENVFDFIESRGELAAPLVQVVHVAERQVPCDTCIMRGLLERSTDSPPGRT